MYVSPNAFHDSSVRVSPLYRCCICLLGVWLADLVRPCFPECVEAIHAIEQRSVFHPRYLGHDLGKAAAAHGGDVIGYGAHHRANELGW